MRGDFGSQAAWFGLIVPAVPLISGVSVILRSCPSGGLECIGRFLTGAFLIVAAAPTALILAPIAAWIDTGTVVTAGTIALGALTSAPLWWLAGRRVARSVSAEETRPWATFLFRWFGVCGAWFAFALAVAILALWVLI